MFLKDLFDMYDRWQREQSTVRELSRLTDQELADIGIHRSNIRYVARKSRY